MGWEPLDVPENGDGTFTDLSRWRLTADDLGRHVWDYLEADEACEARPQTILDTLMLGLPTVSTYVLFPALCQAY
jgi:lanosterol synthase